MSDDVGADPSNADARADQRAIERGVLAAVLIVTISFVMRSSMIDSGLGKQLHGNIFGYLYVNFEPPFLVLMGVFALGVGFLVSRRPAGSGSSSSWMTRLTPPSARATFLIAGAVLALTVATTYLVLHHYLFSMDEYTADFQARIFARGRTDAEIPLAWRSFGRALTPIFVMVTTNGRWMSRYLPAYSLMKAPFVMLGIGTLLNPLLAATSVVCIAGVARRLWPDDAVRQWTAIGLLATSSEFVITSGTGYSMPAHLCLNLLWLWLYLRGDLRSWIGALLVGVVALELHSPFPHALFVAPFLLRLGYERRWGRLASAGLVYGAASVAGLLFLRSMHPDDVSSGGLTTLFSFPDVYAVFQHVVNLGLLLSWQAPVVGVLAVAAVARPRRLDPVLTDLALGLVATLVFFMFFPLTQGHGWGYRYAYQVIGNLLLLAAAGVPSLRAAFGDRRAGLVLASGLAAAVLVQLPARLVETERFVRPFAASNAYVQSRPARVVIVHGDSLWYGADLVRNDPFLEHSPIVLRARDVPPEILENPRGTLPQPALEIRDAQFDRVGAIRSKSSTPR